MNLNHDHLYLRSSSIKYLIDKLILKSHPKIIDTLFYPYYNYKALLNLYCPHNLGNVS